MIGIIQIFVHFHKTLTIILKKMKKQYITFGTTLFLIIIFCANILHFKSVIERQNFLPNITENAIADPEQPGRWWHCYIYYQEPSLFHDDYFSIICSTCLEVKGHDFAEDYICWHVF
jgi:hypothetical protein